VPGEQEGRRQIHLQESHPVLGVRMDQRAQRRLQCGVVDQDVEAAEFLLERVSASVAWSASVAPAKSIG